MKKGVMFSITISVLFSISIMAITNPAYAQVPTTDLSITATVSPNPPVANSPLTYDLITANNGSPVDNVVVTYTLPSGVTLDPLTDSSCSQAGSVVTCGVGSFGAIDSSEFLVVIDIGSNTNIASTFQISGDATDSNPSNNVWPASTTPPPSGPQTLQDLIGLVKSFNLKNGFTHDLIDPLKDALKDMNHNHKKHHEKNTPCNELNEFIKKVNSKEGQRNLTASQISQLIQGANTVKSNNHC